MRRGLMRRRRLILLPFVSELIRVSKVEPLAPPGFRRTDRNESHSPSYAYAVDLNRANYRSVLTTEGLTSTLAW